MILEKMKLKLRFQIAFGFMIGAMVAGSIWAVDNTNSLKTTAEEIIDYNELRANMDSIHVQHLSWVLHLSQDLATNNSISENIELDGHQCNFGSWLDGEERTTAETVYPKLKDLFEGVEKPHEELHAYALECEEIYQSDSSSNFIMQQRALIYKDKIIPVFQEIEAIIELIDAELEVQEISDQVVLKQAQVANRNVLIIGLGCIIVALFGAMVLFKSIIDPIIRSSRFALGISQGKLDNELIVKNQDEIGELAASLNQMQNKLTDIISNIKTASSNISEASNQLSYTAQDISSGASQQASSVEEVSSSIEEMTSNIQQNTDNARETESIAGSAAKDIEQGSNKVFATVEAMKKIAEKISIIDEIAFQTNILALNAAVEAARAGEHGKGFGVVAAEVGKLAERSKIAAAEIDEISRKSVTTAEEAGVIMQKIVPDIQTTSKLVQEITAASLEQHAGAEQINSAIQQLNEVTQQNAAASEEMATSAEEMSSQSEQMNEFMDFFQIQIAASFKERNYENKKPRPKVRRQLNQGVKINLGIEDDLDKGFESF